MTFVQNRWYVAAWDGEVANTPHLANDLWSAHCHVPKA